MRMSSMMGAANSVTAFGVSSSTFILSIFFLLSGSNHSFSQSYPRDSSSGHLIGKLCCPSGHLWDSNSGQCSPPSESLPAIPEIPINTTSESNITWEYLPLRCTPGYEVTGYPLDYLLQSPNRSSLLETEDGIILEFREILNARSMDYCVRSLPDGKFEGVTCRPNITQLCKDSTCVQKCCGQGDILNLANLHCEPYTAENYTIKFQSVSGLEVSGPQDLLVITQFPVCRPVTLKNPMVDPDEEFYLLQEGILYLPVESKTYSENQFCLETVLFPGNGTAEPMAFVCSEPGLPTGATPQLYAYSVGVMISAVFLLVTIIFHICIPKLRDMQGLCLLSHMASLLVADVALFVGYIFSSDIHEHHCVINAFITQYSLLAAFFWLNIMCFDIWRVIRTTVHVIPLSGIQTNGRKRFKIYSLYAWGGPFAISLATIVLHYVPQTPGTNLLKPGFGVISCWFQGDLERFALFYGPIALLFTGNIIMLGHTTVMLYQAGATFLCCKKKTLIVNACNRGRLEAFWHRFSLFMLMAMSWVTEILSWKIPPEEIWYATDFLNTLQGFFVFVIFISYKKKKELVKDFIAVTFQRTSDAKRKISHSEEMGVAWYASKGTSSTYGSQEDNQGEAKKSERRDSGVKNVVNNL